MKKKKYLPLYYEWMERGWFPYLCNYFSQPYGDYSFPENPLFELFLPTNEELVSHLEEGYDSPTAWGCFLNGYGGEPTELRQHIVLFMAAMNGEL